MKNQDLLALAHKRFALAQDADRDNRILSEDDLNNLSGELQWDREDRKLRELQGRACLTSNQLPRFVRQVTGDIRQMNPSVKVSPDDDDASKELAEIVEGICRNIMYRSDGPSVFERAGESAAQCAMGYFRVLTEYENELSFNQEIRIKSILNPFSVWCDPDAVLPTREDARYWFITEYMSEEAFKEAYPGKAVVSVAADEPTENLVRWRDGSEVIVAEYFWIEDKAATLYMMADGSRVVDPSPAPKEGEYIAKRETTIPKIKWAKISGSEVLEGPLDFPGRMLPVVAVMGEELHIGKKVYRSSVIRHAKDDQRLFNFALSAQAETVALQPKAPFLVTPEQIAGYEKFWNEANTANRPYLPYNPSPESPMPSRVAPPMSSSGNIDLLRLAAENMKATTGIYDASLGQRSAETSGVAIRQRQMESDVSTSIYSDNVAKAVAHCGRIILSMLPDVYDTTRNLRIVRADETEDTVPVNQPVSVGGAQGIWNDLRSGRFSVRVSVGPSYTTKRQEGAEALSEIVARNPALMNVAGDLLFESLDVPGAQKIAARLAKTLPPELREKEEEQQPDPMQAQAMQAQQMRGQLAQEMAQLQLQQEQAKTEKAIADAEKAKAEAEKARFELQNAALPARAGFPA